MPITISEPGGGSKFGPGFRIDASTDIVGPLPIDWWWNLRWFAGPPGSETSLETTVPLDEADQHRLRVTYLTTPVNFFIEPTSDFVSDTSRLEIQLRAPGNQVMDQGEVTVVPDMQTGVLYQLGKKAEQAPAGGFTADDRVVLMQLKGNLFWTLFGVLVEELLELGTGLVATPWVPLLVADPLCQEANFARPPLVPLARWIGMRWEVIQWPDGLGIVDGNPDHSYATWGQLSLARTNTDGVSAVYDTRYESRLKGEILWGTVEPETFQVYLLPGVCIRLWSLAGPPWALAGNVANANAVISSDKLESV